MSPYTLRGGALRAEISRRGGSLRVLRHDERDLVASWPEEGPVPYYSGTVLAPWPNRVAGARYVFDDECFELPVNEPQRGHALHGLVAEVDWEVVESLSVADERGFARLAHTVEPSPGYPFTLALELLYVLTAEGLTATLTAQNTGDRAAPYGYGPHPWLMAGDAEPTGWELELPAARVLTVDHLLVPESLEDVEGTRFDFRTPRVIGEAAIDHAFTGLVAGADGLARVRLHGPAGGVEIRWDASVMPWAQVCTGTGLGHRGLAVEPMTCPPDAFNSGTDLVVLQPGDKHEASWTIAPL